MRRKSLATMRCSVARTLDVVGDPWTLLIVRDALFGFRRFDDFVERLGIPRTTLSQRLGALVDAGVLETRTYQDRPPRHEYVLTTKGRALQPVIISLLRWGDEWAGLAEPPVVLVDRSSGRPLSLEYVDTASGRPLSEIDVWSGTGPPPPHDG
ncbi:MAG TPA: helix-turn-helix domain-containing protein [Acidimicrobiales bacterium]|nr:helix-turn-helix domain-containing protein [Acidimicrobiales bacterium]